MNLILGMLMVILGFALWALAGILPVLRLRREGKRVDVLLETTWMGVATLSRTSIPDVRGARMVRDPLEPGRMHPELHVADQWRPIAVRPAPSQDSWARLIPIVDHYAKHDGPRTLVLPLRERMHLMLGFALLFPLGTVSVFAGLLLILRGS